MLCLSSPSLTKQKGNNSIWGETYSVNTGGNITKAYFGLTADVLSSLQPEFTYIRQLGSCVASGIMVRTTLGLRKEP